MNQPLPPIWIMRFFKWFCHRDLHVYIEGDLVELYQESRVRSGQRWASIKCFIEVVKLLRPGIIRPVEGYKNSNNTAMFKNYFKTSMRSLGKNPLNSFINIFGLAAAVGICIFTYSFSKWTYDRDQFHENKDEVFLSTFTHERNGEILKNGRAPRPLVQKLKDDFATVVNYCRIEDRIIAIKSEDNVFHERVRLVDPGFLEMFTFPLSAGTIRSLKDKSSIIFSKNSAEKYFGEDDPIGQEVTLIYGNDYKRSFKVTGVAEEFPTSLSHRFDFLINFENISDLDQGYEMQDWSNFYKASFIQVSNAEKIHELQNSLDYLTQIQNDANQDLQVIDFEFVPLATLHIEAEHYEDIFVWGSEQNTSSIFFLALVSIFMITIACLNYVNIAIVSAAKRLNEIGIRKSIGATRRTILWQFLTENFFVTCFAIALGVLLGGWVFIPWFEEMYFFNMGFTISDHVLWAFLTIVLFITGVFSGLYPAIYISRFEVVGILKGAVHFGRKNPLTKLFLGLQLILACILITTAIMFTRNTIYMEQRSWGYDKEHTLYAETPDYATLEQLGALMKQNPDVEIMSYTQNHIGDAHHPSLIELPDQKIEVDQIKTGNGYLETMGISLIEGRTFDVEGREDRNSILVNETLAELLKDQGFFNEKLKIGDQRYQVIGVVNDFHLYSFDRAHKPLVFTRSEDEHLRYLALNVKSGKQTEVYLSLQDNWAKILPETPFKGAHQEDIWGTYFLDINNHSKVWRGIALITVLLAGLGLFGLVSLNVASRTREFSIRKVMGAGRYSIANQIIRPYIVLFTLALSIAAAPSFYLVKT